MELASDACSVKLELQEFSYLDLETCPIIGAEGKRRGRTAFLG